MTPMMLSAVSGEPSWRAMSSATITWFSCFLLLLPCELCASEREGQYEQPFSRAEAWHGLVQAAALAPDLETRDVPVDHDPGRHARLLQSFRRFLDVVGRVVRSAVGSTEDHVACRVALRLDNCNMDPGQPVESSPRLASKTSQEERTH